MVESPYHLNRASGKSQARIEGFRPSPSTWAIMARTGFCGMSVPSRKRIYFESRAISGIPSGSPRSSSSSWPCRRTAPPRSRWRTRNSAPRQIASPGRLLGRTRNRLHLVISMSVARGAARAHRWLGVNCKSLGPGQTAYAQAAGMQRFFAIGVSGAGHARPEKKRRGLERAFFMGIVQLDLRGEEILISPSFQDRHRIPEAGNQLGRASVVESVSIWMSPQTQARKTAAPRTIRT